MHFGELLCLRLALFLQTCLGGEPRLLMALPRLVPRLLGSLPLTAERLLGSTDLVEPCLDLLTHESERLGAYSISLLGAQTDRTEAATAEAATQDRPRRRKGGARRQQDGGGLRHRPMQPIMRVRPRANAVVCEWRRRSYGRGVGRERQGVWIVKHTPLNRHDARWPDEARSCTPARAPLARARGQFRAPHATACLESRRLERLVHVRPLSRHGLRRVRRVGRVV